MKNLLSILFAVLILLSGMHLTLATHLCGGEVSAVKLSFAHEKASCGMCGEAQNTSGENTFSTEGCCKDEMSFYAVDTNYNPSSFQLNKPVNQLLQVFYIPENIEFSSFCSLYSTNTNVQQPPGEYSAYAVDRPLICVFRI
jgi:hypothetical protein